MAQASTTVQLSPLCTKPDPQFRALCLEATREKLGIARGFDFELEDCIQRGLWMTQHGCHLVGAAIRRDDFWIDVISDMAATLFQRNRSRPYTRNEYAERSLALIRAFAKGVQAAQDSN